MQPETNPETKPNRFPERECCNCTHFYYWDRGGTLYEPPDSGWNCKPHEENVTIQRLVERNEHKAATWCPAYNERLFEQCPHCHQVINQPLHLWEIWADDGDGDAVPVCSTACQQEVEAKAKAEKEEQARWNQLPHGYRLYWRDELDEVE